MNCNSNRLSITATDPEMSLKPKHVEFEPTWNQIRSTVEKVIVLQHVPRSEWNDRFPDLYQLCVAFPGNYQTIPDIPTPDHHLPDCSSLLCRPEPLGDRVYAETKAFLDQHVKQLYQSVVKSSPEGLLSAYHNQWLIYRQGMSRSRSYCSGSNVLYLFQASTISTHFTCI